MNLRNVSTLLLLLMSPLISAEPAIGPGDVTGPEVWGASENVTQIRHLYFSSQPDAEALRIAKQNGVSTVINLRDPAETDWDEESAAKEAGIDYVNIPVSRQSKTLDGDTLARISAAVQATEGQPILLHCSTGNRAAAWLAVHLVEDHGLTVAEALPVAEKAGLSHPGMKDRVRTYLSDQ